MNGEKVIQPAQPIQARYMKRRVSYQFVEHAHWRSEIALSTVSETQTQ
jgi:hypothetical protein